jgi:hypothetical protein
MTNQTPMPSLGILLHDRPDTDFSSVEHQRWYEQGLIEGFDIGKVHGYSTAVEESYPELGSEFEQAN